MTPGHTLALPLAFCSGRFDARAHIWRLLPGIDPTRARYFCVCLAGIDGLLLEVSLDFTTRVDRHEAVAAHAGMVLV